MFPFFISSAFIFNPTTSSSHLKTEIQVNICDSTQNISTELKLDLKKPLTDETSYFVENKKLDLYHRNWVFKIVKNSSKQTATISLKNNDSEQMNATVNTSAKNIKCEYDLHGTFEKLACKMNSEIDLKTLEKNLREQNYLALLSKEQKQWLNDSKINLPTDINVSPAFSDRDYSIQNELGTATFGLSTNFKGQTFLEISIRASETEDKYKVQNTLIDFINSKNIQLCSDQGPINTRDKLESVY
jgi:hypothetical protein